MQRSKIQWSNPEELETPFPWKPFLHQLFFQPIEDVTWSPVKFWCSYRIEVLERCWQKDYKSLQIQLFKRCWQREYRPEEHISRWHKRQ